MRETGKYLGENVAMAVKLKKPMVIEEFGLPRDGEELDPNSLTSYRDVYYKKVFSFFIGNEPDGNEYIAGANFWAFGEQLGQRGAGFLEIRR